MNDMVTNIFSMYPLFSSIEQYRDNHLKHHRHLNTDDDPDWFIKLGKKEFTFPKTKKEFLLTVFSYFTLIAGAKDAIAPSSTAERAKSTRAQGIVRRHDALVYQWYTYVWHIFSYNMVQP